MWGRTSSKGIHPMMHPPPFLEKYTRRERKGEIRLENELDTYHSLSCGRSTGRMSCVNGIGNWYFATKSNAHCDRRSLTWDRTLSCSWTKRLVGRWGSSRSCMAMYSGGGRCRNWCGPSNSSLFEGRRCERGFPFARLLLGGVLLPTPLSKE